MRWPARKDLHDPVWSDVTLGLAGAKTDDGDGALHAVEEHRARMSEALGRDVGRLVAALDYCLNIRRVLKDPVVVERSTVLELRRNALSDPLTTLFNRHYFDLAMAREIAKCFRYGTPLSFVLFDVDHFKSLNDAHGHLIGDEVLRRFGALLRRHVRTVDSPCRIGGDEFAVLMPNMKRSGALALARRVCDAVAAHFTGTPAGDRFLQVTVSGGVAMVPPGESQPLGVIAAADRALYEAKRAGGNLVVAAEVTEAAR